MKIEIIKINEEPIREIEDFEFGSLELSRIFTRTVKEGDTMKIEVENPDKRGGLKNAITANLNRKGINFISWMAGTHIFITRSVPKGRTAKWKIPQ